MGTVLGELSVIFTADAADFLKNIKVAQDQADKFAEHMKSMGETLTKYVTLPLVAAGVASVAMAAEEEAADARLSSALKNVGVSYAKVTDAVHTNITALEAYTGFADTDLQNAFTQMVNRTGNAATSFKSLGIVADIAAAKQIPLADAADIVAKALMGQTDQLKRQGIFLRENMSATQTLTALTEKFGGAAAARMQTVAGRFENLKNQASNAAETFGKALFPAAMLVLNALTFLVLKAQDAATWFATLPSPIKGAIVAFAGLLAALGPVLVALGTFVTGASALASFLTAAGGIAGVIVLFKALALAIGAAALGAAILVVKIVALAAIFAFFYANSQKIITLIGAGFSWLYDQVASVIYRIIDIIYTFVKYIPGIGKAFDSARKGVKYFADASAQDFKETTDKAAAMGGFMENTGNLLKGVWDSAGSFIHKTIDGVNANVATMPPNLNAALGEMGASLDTNALKWKSWLESQKVTAQAFATTIKGAFLTMTQSITRSLLTGTLDWGQILGNFLISALDAMVEWAVAEMGIWELLAAAADWALSNPYTAAVAIAALIGAVYAVKSSYGASFATGGITTGPTNALVGDNPSGKEAIIPLDSPAADRIFGGAGSGGGDQTIIVELDGEVITRTVVRKMPGELRLHGIMRS